MKNGRRDGGNRSSPVCLCAGRGTRKPRRVVREETKQVSWFERRQAVEVCGSLRRCCAVCPALVVVMRVAYRRGGMSPLGVRCTVLLPSLVRTGAAAHRPSSLLSARCRAHLLSSRACGHVCCCICGVPSCPLLPPRVPFTSAGGTELINDVRGAAKPTECGCRHDHRLRAGGA